MTTKKGIEMLLLYREQNGIGWNVVAIQLIQELFYIIVGQVVEGLGLHLFLVIPLVFVRMLLQNTNPSVI